MVYEGKYDGKGLKFAIVASRFNDFVVKSLIAGAVDALVRHNVDEKDIEIFKTPGAFEIPLICKKLAKTKKYDAVIALGAVIRGSTPHFDYVAAEVSKGVAKASYDTETQLYLGYLLQILLSRLWKELGLKLATRVLKLLWGL